MNDIIIIQDIQEQIIVDNDNVVIVENEIESIVESNETVVINQGNIIHRTAGQNLSGHKVLSAAIDGKAIYADVNTVTTSAIIGISLNAASLNDTVNIQTSGMLQHTGWSFTPQEPVFAGLNGQLTQTPPNAAYSAEIGVALSTDTLIINIHPIIYS